LPKSKVLIADGKVRGQLLQWQRQRLAFTREYEPIHDEANPKRSISDLLSLFAGFLWTPHRLQRLHHADCSA
jgi:hypothetical protein